MLVLTRKAGELIHIGDDIGIVVMSINRYTVRLGIEAPKSVAIHRNEIYSKIKREKKQKLIKEDENDKRHQQGDHPRERRKRPGSTLSL